MRIRSIKPEFWSSEDVAALPWEDRLLFIGLWSYVDDNGVGRDVEKLIVADLFPLEDDPRETLARVSRGLQTLSAASLITRYSVDGRPFLRITTWDLHQRIDKPAKSRYPLPTCENAVPRDTLARPSRQSRETLAPGTEEQGNRGTGDKDIPSPDGEAAPLPRGFAEFYDAYPRKVGRQEALKAFIKATRSTKPTVIVAGALRYARDPNLPDKEYIPHPATWLNRGGWDDEPCPPRLTSIRPQPTGAPIDRIWQELGADA